MKSQNSMWSYTNKELSMRIFTIVLLILMATCFSQGATRGDVKVLEASEGIRYLSQKLVKEYLILYQNPKKKELKNALEHSLNKLTEEFKAIAMTTKDSDTKDILEFLAYSKDQIQDIFKSKANKESVALMLDYSETLLEGADSISKAHRYEFSKEEKMLMITKNIEYLLERISKYYMAYHVGFNTHNNKEQLNTAIEDLENDLLEINSYVYSDELQKEKTKMNKLWSTDKIYFQKSDNLFIPNLLLTTIDFLENTFNAFAVYHSKNQ